MSSSSNSTDDNFMKEMEEEASMMLMKLFIVHWRRQVRSNCSMEINGKKGVSIGKSPRRCERRARDHAFYTIAI